VALVVALVVPSALAFLNGSSDAREATLRGELSADVVDLLQGAPELLAFGRQAAALANIDDTDAAIARLSRRRGAVAAWASAIVSVCAGGAVVAILAAAVSAFGRHHLGAGLVAALPLAAVGAFEAVPPLVAAAHRTSRLLAAGERLVALASIPAPVLDPPDPEPLPPGHGVAIHRARLRYGEDLPWALDGLSMTLEPGERVALTGPSGAGKSSLANVLLRFWGLAEGRATLGGVPLNHLAQADVRRVVGLVDQEARLFAGSVRYNVTLARPRADDQEVRRVLGLAQLTGWIDSLPEGTDTPVGEEGGRLSGGQRQRIALARTLLADPAVLILDEPTAGLDQPVARALLEDLMAASEGRSVLLITHVADDAAGCDRIVMIDAGRVVDRS
jgi:ABC-type transport system involved in cytochrome bd biosynthesis fused ATPase/permease subunit